MSNQKANARAARYRQRRRERIGEAADKLRAAAASKKSHAKHRTTSNERRRARNTRDGARRKKARPQGHERTGPMAIVTLREIRLDTTRWRGPGMYKEIALEREADKLLRKAARMNAAQLEKARTERAHSAETPRCAPEKCWCGLCHCAHCQKAREEAAK